MTFFIPKPTGLIEALVSFATSGSDIVLDSFAGSGTTGHAVLKLNAADEQNRQFILVEMKPTIAKEITAERIKRVVDGYTNAKGAEIGGYGGGCQYLRLSDEPLFTPDGQIRPDVTFAQLAEFVWFVETGSGITITPNTGKCEWRGEIMDENDAIMCMLQLE